jgi:two-component system phosphate regulon sensor histidine kinase PhoR
MSYFQGVRWQAALAFGMTLVAAVVGGTAVSGVSRWEVVGVVLAAGAVSAGMLVRSAVQVSASVRAVAEGADKIAAGDLAPHVYAPATQDTRHLAGAFNRMADALRETLEGLSVERSKLSALVETMADGVMLVDPVGAIELSNNAAREMLGIPPEAERLREPDLLALTRRSREAGAAVQEDVVLHPGPRYVSAIAVPLEEGRVLLTIHDETAVRELDVTRREFVSNVSHELRNPLAAMAALVETLENGAMKDPALATDFLGRVHQEVDRMSALVKDLLVLSRAESGEDAGRTGEADVRRALNDAREAVLPKAGDRIEVTLAVEGDLVAAIDSLRFRQVFDNLLDNAVRFTGDGGRVRVDAWSVDDRVHITVSDTGEGIAPEHIPHIFERFYKADPSRHDPGTGLGLSIVRHIVDSRGGSIALNTRLGDGTTFTVILPVASGEPTEA